MPHGNRRNPHDIRRVVENNTFGGAFLNAVSDIRCNPRYRVNRSETVIIGLVSFTAEAWFSY
ncbi:MAG TPA: hypothetical protein PLN69_11470 [bacterium]|nr:hypothetical protein [bacterium]